MVVADNIFTGCVQLSRNHSANEQKWLRNDSALGNFWSSGIFVENLQSREREREIIINKSILDDNITIKLGLPKFKSFSTSRGIPVANRPLMC